MSCRGAIDYGVKALKQPSLDEFLGSNAELVNRLVEKYVPRVYTADLVASTCGPSAYEYPVEVLTKSISQPFWDLMDRGGKRWRPALFLIAYEALGGDPREVLDIAAIPEIVHNGTLIVDDVEDRSETRRGRECIHRIYGEDIAINAGNTMYFAPLQAVMKSSLTDDKKLAILEIHAQEMIRLSFGQAMDIAWHRGLEKDVAEGEYLQMCLLKTASLSRMAVRMAATLAGAEEEKSEALAEFAEAIGVAFQIQDDVLNLAGREEKYGKEIGGDITEGKRTLMVIYALSHLEPKARTRLLSILDSHTRDQAKIKEALAILKQSGAVEHAKHVAEKMVRDAWSKLDGLLPNSEAKRKLGMLADFLVQRDF